MYFAWNSVKKKFNLDIPFKIFFKHIGKPFENILKDLGIKKNLPEITKEFNQASIKNFNKIKLYKNVKQTLAFLKRRKIKIAIVTSKNLKRTKLILKRFNIKVNLIQCPSVNMRGKPFPDQLLKVIKKIGTNKKNCIYIGDTKFDLIASQKSNIDFALASYGYKIGLKSYRIRIKNTFQVTKFI